MISEPINIESQEDLDAYMDKVYEEFHKLDDMSFNANVQPIAFVMMERFTDLPIDFLVEFMEEMQALYEREFKGETLH